MAIQKNVKSRDSSNIGHTRYKTKTNKTQHNTTQKTNKDEQYGRNKTRGRKQALANGKQVFT